MGTNDRMLTRDLALGGRYRIDVQVGRGGMAHVYRATDTVLGRTVAVKVLNPDYASDPAFVERFRREARAAARLNHPNVVAVFDTGSDGDLHYIVMELVEGTTLADVLSADGPLDPARAASIAERIAEALAFAHSNGLVHRDVKPANVMITPAGQVKVMDFGIARLATAHTITQTSTVFGTAAYLAPEQAQGERVDGRADVYALGVVLYEMLAGRVPFEADSALAVASKHVFEEPEPPSSVRPGVPAPLEAVTMRALEKDPAKRYQDAGGMAAALRAAAPTVPVDGVAASGGDTVPIAPTGTAVMDERTEVLPPPRGGAHAAPRSRRGWLVAVIAGAALLAAVLLVAFLGNGRHGRVTPPFLRSHSKQGTHATHRPSQDASPPPATSAPPTTAPATTGATSSATLGIDGATTALSTAVSDALTTGAIDDHTASDLAHAIGEAQHRYVEGDLPGALDQLSHAKDAIGKAVDKGDATAAAGAVISSAIDGLAQAMSATPPPSDQPGGGPGKEKDKHDHGHGNDEGD